MEHRPAGVAGRGVGNMARIDEIADGIYRISTPVEIPGAGGFSFNQYLIEDDEPLLFHTGLRRLFPQVRDAIARVMPVERLRWLAFSHFEADECGALNAFLAVAPRAEPLCGRVAAMVSVGDYSDRPPRARRRRDGGARAAQRPLALYPHLPHACKYGFLMETATKPCCAATFSPRAARTTRRSSRATSSNPARRFVASWTILRTPRTRVRCSSGWQSWARRRWPVCMAALGASTVPRCCAPLPTASSAV